MTAVGEISYTRNPAVLWAQSPLKLGRAQWIFLAPETYLKLGIQWLSIGEQVLVAPKHQVILNSWFHWLESDYILIFVV